VGVRFRDIEKMTQALAAIGIEFEPKNPVTHLMTERKTGSLRQDVLNEKILSAIVEFKTRIENVPAVLRRIDEVSRTLDTVVAVGVSTRCDERGGSALDDVLSEQGYAFTRGKTNLGMGRAGA
jgi:hypothetical protein